MPGCRRSLTAPTPPWEQQHVGGEQHHGEASAGVVCSRRHGQRRRTRGDGQRGSRRHGRRPASSSPRGDTGRGGACTGTANGARGDTRGGRRRLLAAKTARGGTRAGTASGARGGRRRLLGSCGDTGQAVALKTIRARGGERRPDVGELLKEACFLAACRGPRAPLRRRHRYLRARPKHQGVLPRLGLRAVAFVPDSGDKSGGSELPRPRFLLRDLSLSLSLSTQGI